MKQKNKVEPYYKNIAKDFIDTLFDKGYFNSNIKREDMRLLDEYLGFLFQSRCEMSVKADQILRKVS